MRQLHLKTHSDRPRTITARIESIDAALRVRSRDPRCIASQERLRMRRAHLRDTFIHMKGTL